MAGNNVDLNLRVNMKSNVNKELKSLESSVIRTVGAITAALASIQAVLFPVSNAIAFERAMADVAKTTGYSDGQIASLSLSLNDMSVELGIAAVELANVAAIAGQLGLGDQGRESIEQFTASVARASVTLGLSVEKTAEGGAQLSAIFGKSVADVERVFSTINELSNNSVAAGGDLIDIMKRVGTTAGTEFEQVAALAATVRQLGVPNEQAGTGLVKYLGNLLAESKKFAKAMQLTQDEWVDKVKDNSVDALKYVLNELSQLGAAQQSELIKKLFGSGRLFALGDKLVGDAEQQFLTLNKMLGLATEGYRDGTSSINEYNRIMETTSKQVDVLKASFISLGIKVGNQMLPAVQRAVESMSRALQNEEVITYFEKLGASLGNFIDDLADSIRAIGGWVDAWENVLTGLKIFIGYKIVAAIVGWTAKLFLVIAAFKTIIAQITIANALAESLRLRMLGVAAASASAGTAMVASNATAGATSAVAAMGRLGKAVKAVGLAFRFMGGIASIALTVIGVKVYENWDTIMSFLGFVDAEKLKAERQAEQIKKQREDNIKKAISEAKEASSKLDAALAGKPIRAEVRIEVNAEDTKKNLNELFNNTINLQDIINKTTAGIEGTFQARSLQFEEYTGAIREVSLAEDALENARKGRQGTDRRGRSILIPDPQGVQEAVRELEAARRKVAIFEKDASSNALTNASSSLAQSKAAERFKFNLEELAKTYDVYTEGYVRHILNAKLAQESTAKYRNELLTLQKIQDGIKVEDQGSTEFKNRETQIKFLEEQVEENEESASILLESAEKYKNTLSTEQQKLVSDTLGKSTKDLKLFTEALSQANLTNIDQVTKSLLDNKEAITFNYLKALQVETAYKRMAAAADDYKKRAASALANVNNEIAAMRLGLAKFGRELSKSLINRKAELKLDIRIDKLDDELEKAKKKINDYYDNLEQREQTSGFGFSSFSGSVGREKALQDLEDQFDRDTANAKGKAILEEYNRELANSTRLMNEATAASKEGKLEDFLALKDASKKSLDAAQDLITDMQGIRTKDVFGEDSFKFDDAAIQNMFDDTVAVGTELEAGLRKSTTIMNTEAIITAKKFAELLAGASASLEGPANQIAKLSELKGFGEFLERSTIQFNESTSNLNTALKSITDASFVSIDSLVNFNTDEFQASIEGATTDGAREGFIKASQDVQDVLKRVYNDPGVRDASTERLIEPVDVPVTANVTKMLADMQASLNQEEQGVEVTVKPRIEPLTTEELINLDATGELPTIPVKADTEEIRKSIEAETYTLSNLNAEINKLTLTDVTKQSIKLELEALIQPTTFTDPTSGFALGGSVSGAGTSTSDSIPAWLSNGEWVMDAVTTKFFGGSFFAGLQAMARGGRRPSMKGGLPAFAGGGGVAGAESVGSITLNLGGKGYTLYGERQQAKELVNLFKKMDRG